MVDGKKVMAFVWGVVAFLIALLMPLAIGWTYIELFIASAILITYAFYRRA